MSSNPVHPPKKISLIPYVCGAGASLAGAEEGPAALKNFGLQTALGGLSRAVIWQDDPATLLEAERALYQDLPPLGSAERRAIVLKQCRRLSDAVERAVKNGALPVVIGGDHSSAAGSLAGFARATGAHGRIGVLWVDAHSDINTPDTSPSQALHGMPVAALLGLGDAEFAQIGGGAPVLRPENIIYTGLRSVDPGEIRRIRDLGITAFLIEHTDIAGWRAALLDAVRDVAARTDYLVLSIDMDAFDPSIAPSVGSPEEYGFDGPEILSILQEISRIHAPDMIEIVEFNPRLSGAQKTYALLCEVLCAVLASP
jgi:arginase